MTIDDIAARHARMHSADVDPMDRSLAVRMRHAARSLEKRGLEELAQCVNEGADRILLIKLFRENAYNAGHEQGRLQGCSEERS